MEAEIAAAGAQKNVNGTAIAVDPRLHRFDAGNDHPTTNIPFTATIDGRQFSGSAISLVSAVISGLAGGNIEGIEKIAVLRFGFGAYAISIPVSVRITRLDAATGTFRLDFIEPAGEHLPALRYILNSYVAGDMVSLGGLIAAREKPMGTSIQKMAAPKSWRQYFAFAGRSIAAVMLTVALLSIAGKLAYERLFSSDVAQLATISWGAESMRAIASGQIAFLNAAAAKGEVVYAVRTASGDTLNVVMPCECKAIATGVSEGSTVMSGETVIDLVRPGDVPSVVAFISSSQAKALLEGDVADLQFAGGASQTVSLAAGAGSITPLPGSDKLRAVFSLTSPVPDSLRNSLVSVRIMSGRVDALRRLILNS